MENQKILKPTGKIVIVSDYREKEVIEHLKKFDASINVQALKVGDYVCSEDVCVERKSYDDFVNSIINGRIFEQADALSKNFKKPVIVIEGYSTRQINENALKAAVASLLIDFNISLISTKNPYDTAKTVFWIAKKEQSNGGGMAIKVGKKPKETKKLQEFIVASIPGISTVLAKRLLNQFGSIEKIFGASAEELGKVVGEKKGKKIKKILTAKY
ncbi:MAG: ERCC4 domain-containing protein [Candidatus Heimdallarchaeota archaeon]